MYSYEANLKWFLQASIVTAISALLIVSPAAAQNESQVRLFEQQNHQPITPVGYVLNDTEESLEGSVGGYEDGVCNCRSCRGKRSHCRRKLWESSLNVGMNGSSGSSRDLNLVVGFNAKRVKELNTFTTDLDYLFQEEAHDRSFSGHIR